MGSAKLLLVFVVIYKKLLYSTEFQLDKWNSNLPTDREKLKKEDWSNKSFQRTANAAAELKRYASQITIPEMRRLNVQQ